MRKITLLCAVLMLFAAVPSFARRERVVKYYGLDYNQPTDNFCTCLVSPCWPAQIGERGFFCDESLNYEWGEVNGSCYTSVTVTYYDWCPPE